MSSKRRLLKIIILGDSNVGKTSLMNRYVNATFDHRYKATIGADFLAKEIEIDGQKVTLQLWDTAGQERFQSLGSAFYRGADACILVFDLTLQSSFAHVGSWLEEFSIQAGCRDALLIGNKADLADEKREVTAKTARTWGENQPTPIPYFEASAKDGAGIDEAFKAIASAALAKKSAVDEDMTLPQSVNLSSPPLNRTESSDLGCQC